jgi:hypothetical protein
MMKAGYVPPEIWRIGKSIGELWEMVGKLVPPEIRRIGKKERWIPRCRLQYGGLERMEYSDRGEPTGLVPPVTGRVGRDLSFWLILV